MKMDTKWWCYSCAKWLEALCIIFSIINAITCVLAFISSLFLLLFAIYIWVYNLYHGYLDDTSTKNSDDEGWALFFKYYMLTAFICCIAAGLALYYAVLLCVGLQNNNKRYIKTYLKYGVGVVALSVLGTLGYVWLDWEHSMLFNLKALISLQICFIYSGILLLIYKTYIASDRQETDGKLLDTSQTQQSYGCN